MLTAPNPPPPNQACKAGGRRTHEMHDTATMVTSCGVTLQSEGIVGKEWATVSEL